MEGGQPIGPPSWVTCTQLSDSVSSALQDAVASPLRTGSLLSYISQHPRSLPEMRSFSLPTLSELPATQPPLPAPPDPAGWGRGSHGPRLTSE